MSLVEKIGKKCAGIALACALALPGCAIRQGNERVSFFAIPFVGIAATMEEFYEGSNNLKKKMEMFATGFGYDIKGYEDTDDDGRLEYKGKCEVRIHNNFGEISVKSKVYDADGKIVEECDGIPGSVPSEFRQRIYR